VTIQIKKDNGDLPQKVLLRSQVLDDLRERGVTPVVVETNGGWGELYRRCYSDIPEGVVLEKDGEKAKHLARQRPSWATYAGDNVGALSVGVGAHLEATVLDADPYGDPWPLLEAWFGSRRRHAPVLGVIVTDGLGMRVRRGWLWRTASARTMVEQYGNQLDDAEYLRASADRLGRLVRPVGYQVDHFGGYRCGHADQMTHWRARLRRAKG
jgi:hypothetical protein